MQLAQHFPKEVQDGLMGGMGDLKAYRAALREFHKVHGCILDPPPYEVTYSLDQVFGENGDPTVAKAPCASRVYLLCCASSPSILVEF